MKFDKSYGIKEVAEWIGAAIKGNVDIRITGVNEIHKVEAGDVSFVDHPKYFAPSLSSAASAVIVPYDMDCPPGKVLLIHDVPFKAYGAIVRRFRTNRPIEAGVEYSIGAGSVVEPGAIIGHDVTIGKDCHIQAGAIIRPDSIIGDRVIIQSGAVIGGQAFYFKKWPEGYEAWPGCGRVIIEDDVWIGAATTIAQGVSGDTIIGQGTKIDCQVMIGHGAVIGKNCVLAAQVGIAGKTKVGNNCTIYGQVGIAQNLTIGDNSIILAQSGVTQDLEGGTAYFGSPAEEMKGKYKEIAALRIIAKDYLKKGKG